MSVKLRSIVLTNNDLQRFWSKVDRSGGDDACWLWLRSKNEHGYGIFSTGDRTLLASRVSYVIKNGDIPGHLFVLHRCDNPPCCNPSHLFLGTQKENLYDMQSKGRKAVPEVDGEKNPFAKLSDAQVAEIRRRHTAGESQRALAREFGVSKTHIGRIVRFENRVS